MAFTVVISVASVYTTVSVSTEDTWTETAKVPISVFALGRRNLWSEYYNIIYTNL